MLVKDSFLIFIMLIAGPAVHFHFMTARISQARYSTFIVTVAGSSFTLEHIVLMKDCNLISFIMPVEDSTFIRYVLED